MKVNLYSAKSKTVKSLALPKEFGGDVNKALLAQAIHIYRDRTHAGNSKVKTRGEINLTTAKWYKQKGTGRARHGSQSAPIFVGGGVAHGPKGVKRVLGLPKKMKIRALASAFALKAKEKAIVAVKDLTAVTKTKEAMLLVDSICKGEKLEKGKLMLALSEKNKGIYKYFKNIDRLRVERYSDLNAYTVYFGGKLILDADNFKKTK
ncbi:50S ribosomal protein L4 [Candidatus Woesebacteria bacterium RIFCSPHIGHO2_01_FULL_44_21]|uniref:Large ribosomal subunit protein uL4 n=1 Tax=Candidatus Woesebacteria bacterium RIFCSPHIGHO2_01_FULL_44_21 TaxID=1802503 RepID=A0A1F7Z1N9_9BACT|nr:MAG: 50S ribosomal protein L4 [Candidatus Woesebacteria bacterium RIFCSPHIGHO2_01_FULL_44_21]OGM71487.1 MAG: 50S ribosomal protein L4 [Candidatus Woesebacteria bacterium RIFCSPLOWO2_01_FULL_44_24b]